MSRRNAVDTVATIGSMIIVSIVAMIGAFLAVRRWLPLYGENVFVGGWGVARATVPSGAAPSSPSAATLRSFPP
jgi:hypothetical protein